MKSSVKRILSVILVAVLAIALVPCAFAANTVSTPTQVLTYGLRSGHGHASIAQGVLYRGEQTDDVYLISLGGADLSVTQKNNFTAFFASAMSLPTFYFETMKDAILANVPEGSKILFAGHSVGGTVAQQLAGDKTLRSKYEIINVLACGAPTVVVFEREGALHRLADVFDPIAQISLAGPVNFFYQVSYENSGALLQLENPHAKSYYQADTWSGYDCLGVKGGNAYLVFTNPNWVSISLDL